MRSKMDNKSRGRVEHFAASRLRAGVFLRPLCRLFFFAALATFMSMLFSSSPPSLSSLPRLRFFAGVFFASDFSFFTAFSLPR
jgi:hypothetical protein